MTQSRLQDANDDLNTAMDALKQPIGEVHRLIPHVAREVVRVVGNLAVTMAMLYDARMSITVLAPAAPKPAAPKASQGLAFAWSKGVQEAIDKLYAYQMSAPVHGKSLTFDKAMELLNTLLQNPPKDPA